MLRAPKVLLSLLLAAGIPVLCSADVVSDVLTFRQILDEAVGKVKPGLVRIHVVSTHYNDGRAIKYESVGSGAIITPEGHVITNHHVAGHATRMTCTFSNKEEIEADLVGKDPLTDIAVIKLKADPDRKFPTVAFGDSDTVEVGDQVLAMGSPMALSQSVTLGIVSNTEMIMPRFMGPFARFELDGEDVGSMVRWIGHDAAIYGGNSGGPLVNLNGEIIGINEIGFGLSGAIPGNLAKSVAFELIEHGKVSRSWLGMDVQPLLKHMGRESGVLIRGTVKGSPAEVAGVAPGDILLRVNETPVTVQYLEQLPAFNQLMTDLPVGKDVKLTVLREGDRKTLTVETDEREEMLPPENEIRQWGITARDISFIMAKELKRETTDGIYVTSVQPGGPAGDAKPVIQRRDVITEVGGKPVKNIEEFRALTAELTEGAEEPVPALTTFERKAGLYVTVVDVGIKELRDPGLEVKKAWLPVDTQVITRDIAEAMGDEDLTGFRVTQVYPDSAAQEAGIELGDFITAVDGQRLTASAPEHYEELPALIRQYRVGTTAELMVIRGGEAMTVPVELERAPMLPREMKKYRDELFEFTVRNVAFYDRADEEWEEGTRGVLVEDVKSGSWAALGDLLVGDLIQEVDGQTVTDVEGLEDLMDAITEAEPKYVVLRVLRGIRSLFIELEPKWQNI